MQNCFKKMFAIYIFSNVFGKKRVMKKADKSCFVIASSCHRYKLSVDDQVIDINFDEVKFLKKFLQPTNQGSSKFFIPYGILDFSQHPSPVTKIVLCVSSFATNIW